MTLQDRLAALPPEPPAIKTIGDTHWWYSYKGVVGLNETEAWARYYQDKAEYLLARNALLCEALRIMRENAEYWALRNKSPVMSEGDFKTWHALSYGSNAWLGAHATLAACEVKS